MSVITVENLIKKFSERAVLDGVSFTVQKNERVALVGSNGSGKTTLLKIIMGIESADNGRVVIPKALKTGYISQSFAEFYNEEADIMTATAVAEIDNLEKKMRTIEEEISKARAGSDEQNKLMSVYSGLTDKFESMDGYAFEKMMQSVLNGLGLNREALKVPLSKLSGGEKLRVLLARVVISRPDLLILDEPTNHLDIKALEWLEKYLLNFKGGVLMVSHDRYFLDKVASRVIELEFGTVRGMRSSYSDYLEQKKILKDFSHKKQKDIERQIKNEKKVVQTLRHQRKISAFNSRLKKIDKLEEKLEGVRKEGASLHLGRIPSAAINMGHHVHVSAEAAFAKELGKKFGDRVLFKNANFVIKGGEKVGIIGDNGTGKTTLLNILSGRDDDFVGEASIGNWIKYGFITQDIVFEDSSMTVLEKLIMEAKIADFGDLTVKQALEYAAHYKFYGDETSKNLSVLSGGEKSRLALAIVMLSKPNCLVMDEPTNHLDIYTREIMEGAFEEFKGTIIAISHDRFFLNNCINRILSIEDIQIKVINGNYNSYIKSKSPEEIVEVVSAAEVKKEKYLKHMELQKQKRLKKAKDERVRNLLDIEKEITTIEIFKEKFEETMGSETGYESYLEYQKKVAHLEKLYIKWEKLNSSN